ncbi:MAG: GDSL-type esterase/lipase family protein [Candidatus Spyradenecus sp.]
MKRMMIGVMLLGVLLAPLGVRAEQAAELDGGRATQRVSRLETVWWKTRLAEQEAKAKQSWETVLLGDSITHNWDVIAPDLQKQYFGDVLNLGMSGDKTQNVLWRIARIDWQVVAPKRIMLMIGTNNTGHQPSEPPENTYRGIATIVRELRAKCPQAKITVLAIFPRAKEKTSPLRVTNDAINAKLPQLADGKQVFFRDISAYFLLPDGETLNMALMPDALHPNKEGHRLWAAATAFDFLNDYNVK